jgi:nucleoside-diphosphate-sugar epimerase
LDLNRLQDLFREFGPTEVVHLAATTGFLTSEDAEGFRTNVEGTANVLQAAANCPSVQRCVFASSHSVALPRVADRIRQSRRVALLYDESKLEAERVVRRNSSLNCTWCIVRPCPTWGPWFGRPYLDLFLAIGRGRYFHPGRSDAPKRLAFVGNSCCQIIQLLRAPADQIHRRTFYLADYKATTLRVWADLIADRLGVRRPRTMNNALVRIGAMAGDVLKGIGYPNPPLTSFRLANIHSDTSNVPTKAIKAVAGPLPFSLGAGVDRTIDWLRWSDLLK